MKGVEEGKESKREAIASRERTHISFGVLRSPCQHSWSVH